MAQSAETTVQMGYSVQSNRTNDIMRTLNALTSIFLPLTALCQSRWLAKNACVRSSANLAAASL